MAKTPELRNAMATIHRELPGRYDSLEALLANAEPAVQIEFARLVRTFEDRTHQERREGRKDAWMRGRF